MKICQFCDSENPSSALACVACGGNAFRYRCGNCGTEFEKSNYCPSCGVKADAKVKRCPSCGGEYFSAACPNCGYIKNTERSAAFSERARTQAVNTPPKKRKTWLWVLGWIFIFPIPLTILASRSGKLSQTAKIGIIIAAWVLYLIFLRNG